MQLHISPFYGTDFTNSSVSTSAWADYGSATRFPDYAQNWGASTGATWEITGVQLELGSVATDFEHRSYGEELALCQRYYQAVEGAGAFEFDGLYASGGGNGLGINFPLPVEMRASPTLTHSWNDTNNIASQSITASSKGLFVGGTTSGGGRTAMNKTGSGYVRLNAEL